jgi:hypothetical protein
MKKYFALFLYVMLIIAAVVLQQAGLNSLPYWFSRLNLCLLLVIIFLFFLDFKKVLILSLGLGLLLDIFSFQFFGAYTVTFLATVFLADVLLTNWFTNRSTYSFLALTFFTTLFYNFFLYFLLYLSNFLTDKAFFLFSGTFWLGLGLELLWNLGAVFLLFWTMSLTSHRLKPIFLEKR